MGSGLDLPGPPRGSDKGNATTKTRGSPKGQGYRNIKYSRECHLWGLEHMLGIQ